MHKLLKEEKVKLIQNAQGDYRATDESFVRVWQLADFIEDVDEKLDMANTGRQQAKVRAWLPVGNAEYLAFRAGGILDGKEELTTWDGGTVRTTHRKRIADGQARTDFLKQTEKSRILTEERITWEKWYRDAETGEGGWKEVDGSSYTLLHDFEEVCQELHDNLVEAGKILLDDSYFSYYACDRLRCSQLHRDRKRKLEYSYDDLTLKNLSSRPDNTMAKLAASVLRRYEDLQYQREEEQAA